MKIKITILFVFFNLLNIFSQQESLITEVKEQAVKINKQSDTIISLKKTIKFETEKNKIQLDSIAKKEESIKNLKSTLSKLNKFKVDKKKIDLTILQKNDSIILLKKQVSLKNQQILDGKSICEEKILHEKEFVKDEILSKIYNTYKNKNFDELILSSNKLTVERDLQLIGENIELKQILLDLKKYFEAKSLLDKQYNIEQIKIAQSELIKIKQDSVLLDKLKEQIESYHTFNSGLIECLNKIIIIDKNEGNVSHYGDEIKQKKQIKITAEISNYIFNYDFNFIDYPYLSNILSQVIKVKFPNPDQDISIFLNKIK